MMAKDKKTPGQSVYADYAVLKPARVRYTSKWPLYRAGKFFFAACPCCGAVVLFQIAAPRRSDIVNPDDVPAEQMPRGDDDPRDPVYGKPVSRCKKCGKFYFNQYVYEAQHFRSADRGFFGFMRKALVPRLVSAGLLLIFTVIDAAGIRGWNLLDLMGSGASENQEAFLESLLINITGLLALFVIFLAYHVSYSLNDTWGHKGVRVNAKDPEYIKFLRRIGHPVPQQYLDILRESPEDAVKVSARERNFAELPSGRRLYRKRNGHCSCCGYELDNTRKFPARLGKAVRVCPGCKNEYFDADFWELAREGYPEKTYARIRRECGNRRTMVKVICGFSLFMTAMVYVRMVYEPLFFSDRYPLFTADPPYNEIDVAVATAGLIFAVWLFLTVEEKSIEACRETACPKSKFRSYLKESEQRLRDRRYAECYDLGRRMLSGKDAPEAAPDKSGAA
ncbi:hypothetical protein [Succinimonas sp.]|uniref:hypothetical protein n=1 Tax=Succinimonas sp. TaxID=1936151 RepID=UPI00386A494E